MVSALRFTWRGRVGAWERVRCGPAPPPAPHGPSSLNLANLPAVSWRLGLSNSQYSRIWPQFGALCTSWVRGSWGIAPALPTGSLPWVAGGPTGGTTPSGRGAGRRPHPPHLLALSAAPAPVPAGWRSQCFKPQGRHSPAGLNHRTAVHGGNARHSPRPCAARRPARPAPDRHTARGTSQIPRDPRGTSGGTEVARSDTRRRRRPPDLANGRREQRTLRVAGAGGCARVSSFWPQACCPSIASTMPQQQLFRALVSAQWVAEALGAPRAGQPLQLLDASWYLPKLGRDARREFEERHIPGASFFDIDQCSDRTSPYDHMLPSAAHFADYVGNLGVGATTHVVVYDASDQGLYAAPRVWWMFRAFGHRAVSLLDGGFRNWLRQGLPLSSGKSRAVPTQFRATLDPTFVKTYEDIKENIESRRFQVVDARVAGRFRGTEPEPRDGIEPGHIPGTVNIPFVDFLTSEGLEKSPEEIHRLFQDKMVDLAQPLVATCGSGVTACHVALGAYLCGKPDVAIYDGSWVEWYMRAQPEEVISEGRGKTR